MKITRSPAYTASPVEGLSAVLSGLGVGVLVLDEHEEVAEWNEEAEGIFVMPLERHMKLVDLVQGLPSVLRGVIFETLADATGGHKSELRAYSTEMGQAWSVIASPMPGGGAALVFQDVSEHERTMRELSRMKRLAEIGQMTAAIAHEIRNPLTGIRSAAQMVQTVGGEAAEFGRIIEEESLKLNSLCDEFLEFAKPLKIRPVPTDVASVLGALVDRLRYEADAMGVSLTFETSSDAQVDADPLRLEQVCRNLLRNAVQASEPGGEVRLNWDGTRVVVEDTGVGMAQPMLDKLFTPFFTTKPSGTGLGLSMVRKIADAHGWLVKVSSEVGQGTRFEIILSGTPHRKPNS
jgi:signal transduction histidine kinase